MDPVRLESYVVRKERRLKTFSLTLRYVQIRSVEPHQNNYRHAK